MATPIQQLKGTAAELDAVTLPNGVIVWDETNKIFRGHDGVTPGGHKLVGSVALDALVAAVAGKASLAGDNMFSGANTFTKTQKWSKGADVVSAAALTLGDDGNYFDVTGTTAITSIATVGVGTVIKSHFDGALTLTHHSTDLVLPYGVDISTYAGMELEFVEYDTGKWRCVSFVSPPLLHVRDQKTSGTEGGTSISGTQVRTLNTVVSNGISGASLSSNQITLPAGTYDIFASVPAMSAPRHKAWLRTSGGSLIVAGSSEGTAGSTSVVTRSLIKGRFTLAVATVLEIAHYTSAALASTGLGYAGGAAGIPEVYTDITIRKVA